MTVLSQIGWRLVDRVGPFSPHGLGIAVGYVLGGMLTARRAERLYGIKRDHIWNALVWAVVGVIVGARLFYIAGHLDTYFPDDPLGVFRVWEGGVVFYGGAIGGILAAIPYLRRHGIPVAQALDAAAPGFPLGLIIGRIGDLIIGDHLGSRTDFFLGYRYDGGALPPGCTFPGFDPDPTIVCPSVGEVVHQTALYDLMSVLIILPIALWFGRVRRAPGVVMAFVAILYAVGRLAGDFTRPAATYGGLRGTQWVSVAIILLGTTWLLRSRGLPPAEPVVDPEESDEPEEAEPEEGEPLATDEHSTTAPRETSSKIDTDTAARNMIAEGAPAPPPPRADLPPEGSEEARMVAEGGPIQDPPSWDSGDAERPGS